MIKTLSNIFPSRPSGLTGYLKSGEINLHVLINLPILTMQWQAK